MFQIGAIQPQTLVVATGDGIGTENQTAILTENGQIRSGDLSGNIQIHHKFPYIQHTVGMIGRSQTGDDVTVLLQFGKGVFCQIILHQCLKRGSHQNQRHEQNDNRCG